MQEMEDRYERPEPDFSGADYDAADLEPQALTPPQRRRILWAVVILTALVLLAVLPPLVSMNRFRRQISGSISASLGRPVHLDSVTLNMLPMPGFTLGNFVVGEDPAFGFEPVIRADSVRVTLRVRSLWRRRVEFSRISLTDPSVNLVRRDDGRWNIESILLHASRITTAPTAQKTAGDAPRFPYIEATGARVNVKMGLEKLPISLTEADFALWLPQPEQWRLRLEGRPTRTDSAPTDTGLLRVQGTLGKATAMQDVPVDLSAEWRSAPLGGVSRVLVGHDTGLRGDMTLQTTLVGTLGTNVIASHLELQQVRRSDFVPAQTLAADLTCKARAEAVFQRLSDVHCAWPTGVQSGGMTLAGELPQVKMPNSFVGTAALTDVPAQSFVDALRIVSARVPPELNVGGTIAANLQCCASQAKPSGDFSVEHGLLKFGDAPAFFDGSVAGELSAEQITLRPLALDLGGPAPATLDGHADRTGCEMHLTGSVTRARLMLMAQAVPQFGDGLMEILPEGDEVQRVDLVAHRTWSGGQAWFAAPVRVGPLRRRFKRK